MTSTEVSYPREKPWRVFWRVYSGFSGAWFNPVLKVLLFFLLAALLADLFKMELAPLLLVSFGSLTLWQMAIRFRFLRATFLTEPGIDLPGAVEAHPLIRPAVLTGLAGLCMLAAGLLLQAGVTPQLYWLYAAWFLFAAAWQATGMMSLKFQADRLVSQTGFRTRSLDYAAVDKLRWNAGRNPLEPDSLHLYAGAQSLHLRGQHDRSDDAIRFVLREILEPRLATARDAFRQKGEYHCGPLILRPDAFSRPGDSPPLYLPFSLTRSAHIDPSGRFAVEIDGRSEPLVLLTPDEFPMAPLALRLVGDLWNKPPETGDEGGEADESTHAPADEFGPLN